MDSWWEETDEAIQQHKVAVFSKRHPTSIPELAISYLSMDLSISETFLPENTQRHWKGYLVQHCLWKQGVGGHLMSISRGLVKYLRCTLLIENYATARINESDLHISIWFDLKT